MKINIGKCIKNILWTFFISTAILLFILLLTFFGPREIYDFEREIYYGYDLLLEYKIAKAFDKVIQTKDFKPLALQDFSDKKIVRACTQWPYATQPFFEERIGEKVSNFNEEDRDIVWLFFSDGSISKVRTPMRFPFNERIKCTEKTLAFLFKPDEHSSGNINFYFN